jgi:hypothetical protein
VLPPLADVAAGPIDFSRNLEDGRYLNIKVDLWQGKRLIKETFAAMLNRYQPKATRPPLIRGDSIRTEEEMDQMLQAFQLVEKHEGGIHPAMWEMFPETKGKHLHSDDPSEAHEEEGIDPDDLQRMHDKIQRWHLKIKEFLEAHDLYPLPSKSN